ncbi:MAG: cation:proton antiporter [Patescibacteria group bacterium]|nr:cation:proton antiporter [Patescibacteria group bacterium]
MSAIFIQLSLVLAVAVAASLIMRLLRQPLIIGYIITGIIVGPMVLGLVRQGDSIEAFAHIGVALLLFIVGLGLHPKMIRDVGGVAVVTGLGQIIFTTVIGWVIGVLLGYASLTALYLAFAFTMSSTIIILRLLHAKEDQDTLYGRIAIGFLLVQDFVAMIVFMVLASARGGGPPEMLILSVFLKIVVVVAVLLMLVKFIVPLIDRFLAPSSELLFIFAISVCFIFASLFEYFDFSRELGALVAGLALSFSPCHREMATRLKPLRDFFLVAFFIVLGAGMSLVDIEKSIPMIVFFSAFILIGNPLIVYLIMTCMGYTKKTSFFAGLTVAQISEFSLILLGMGVSLGHIPASIVGPATVVGVLTIGISTYMIMHNHTLYRILERFLSFLAPWHKPTREKGAAFRPKKIDVLVLGSHRLGGGIVNMLKELKVNFLVIDHDPLVIHALEKQKVPAVFGSADDISFLDHLPLKETRLIISTIPDVETNEFLVHYAKTAAPAANVVCVANHASHAKNLYDAGAAYVVMPPYLGRKYIIDLVKRNRLDPSKYREEKACHIKDLRYIGNGANSDGD